MTLIKDFTRFFSNNEIVAIFIYLVAMAAIPGISYIAAVHLIFVALIKKKEWYFKSLMYFALLKHLNPIFHPPSSNLFLLFVILLFIVFVINVISSSKIWLTTLEKKFYLLLLFFAITSIVGSIYPSFSLIRITIIGIFVFVVFQSIKRIGSFDLLQFMMKLTTIIIVISLPLILISSGYLKQGFFQGIFNHSQSFALILLPFYMMYLIAVLSHKISNSLFHTFILSMGIIELILSGSRAAMGAVIITLVLYLVLQQQRKIKLKTLIVSLFLLFGFIILVSNNYEQFEQKISSFFLKYKDTGGIEEIQSTVTGRIYLIEVAINNLKEYPLTGIGFNVQTYYQDPFVEMNLPKLIKYIPGTDIMYSRPLEKGNLYASVFEESGVIAGIYFLFIIFSILWILYRSHIPYLWVPFLAMMINFNGEASLFSPSGPGNFQMIFLVVLYVLSIQKYQEKGNI